MWQSTFYARVYFIIIIFQLSVVLLMSYMSRFANNTLLGSGVRVWIREQRKIKRRSKALLSLCWQSWTSLYNVSRLSEEEDETQPGIWDCQSTKSLQVCNTSPHWAMSSLWSCCPRVITEGWIYKWHTTGMQLAIADVVMSSLYIPVSLCYGLRMFRDCSDQLTLTYGSIWLSSRIR